MENTKQLSPVIGEIERLDKNAHAIAENISALMSKLEPVLTPPGAESEAIKKEEAATAVSSMANTLDSINDSLESSIDRLHRIAKRIEV